MRLASDSNFLQRLASLLVIQAEVVAAESTGVANHTQRRILAQSIITNPYGLAASLAPAICNSTNLLAGNTTFDMENACIVTDVSDGSISSQIVTLWNALSGV